MAFNKALEGNHLFIGGDAGSGKTFLLRLLYEKLRVKFSVNKTEQSADSKVYANQESLNQIIQRKQQQALYRKQRSEKNRVGLCSMTGISALALNGNTLHSFLGLAPSLTQLLSLCQVKPKDEKHSEFLFSVIYPLFLNHLKQNHFPAYERWLDCQCLIIDECSMLMPELLDFMDYFATRLRSDKRRHIAHSNQPFGGIQMILSGDFMQLPPIYQQDWQESLGETNKKALRKFIQEQFEQKNIFEEEEISLIERNEEGRFCFDAKSWRLFDRVYLKETMRQKDDTLFSQLLNFFRYFPHSLPDGTPSIEMFPVVDAILKYLQKPFEERRECPGFQIFSKAQHLKDLKAFLKNDQFDSDLNSLIKTNYEFDDLKFKQQLNQKQELILKTASSLSLFSTNQLVEQHNDDILSQMPGQTITYTAIDGFKTKEGFELLEEPCLNDLFTSKPVLKLKPNLHVILNRNIWVEMGLVNGRMGIVYDFIELPLSPALKKLLSNQKTTFRSKETVHLPRVRFPIVNNFVKNSLEENKYKMVQIEKQSILLTMWPVIQYGSDHQLLPEFFDSISEPEQDFLCSETETSSIKKEKEHNERIPFRFQLPLQPAHALTIHKSQGQTIQSRLSLSLDQLFTYGQFYVGISRCQRLLDLQILDYQKQRQRVWSWLRHPKVDDFYHQSRNK